MKSTVASMVLVLMMAISIFSVQGILETNDANHKCRCLKMSDVPLPMIKTLSILPPSRGCRNSEFIVTLKSGRKICMDPKNKLLNLILKHLKRNKSTTPNLNIQRQR
ncbi:C-X-C motif chemokine 13 [Antechinus flavipes]|uniref:C-X-C motif chemokine 13 n=1 Tax=Antechinus flavipes TaxID=38775 RepID=UPI00223623D3|nr:C-X-C motif chemokine 13 [Antechinus flavipes]